MRGRPAEPDFWAEGGEPDDSKAGPKMDKLVYTLSSPAKLVSLLLGKGNVMVCSDLDWAVIQSKVYYIA